jgi:hypothetical protein
MILRGTHEGGIETEFVQAGLANFETMHERGGLLVPIEEVDGLILQQHLAENILQRRLLLLSGQ